MKRIFFLFAVWVSFIDAYKQEALAHIQSFLKQYKRPITLIELGSHAQYVQALARNRHAVCVMYLTSGDGVRLAQRLGELKLRNLVLLSPAQSGERELKTLGRCEHFDVSVVDEESFSGMNFKDALPLLLRLGDYFFCIVNEESVSVVEEAAQVLEMQVVVTDIGAGKKICRCDTLKKGLDIARWNMYKMPEKNYERYAICSDFTTKTLRKGSTHSTWIPGINMVTFIGYRGLLPADADILAMIGALKKMDHNDLVLGNMIVQGHKLAVIDFEDARRSMRQSKCLRVAQEFFKNRERFNKGPEQALEDYKNTMRK